MVLEHHPVVITDSVDRDGFERTSVDRIRAAFDRADAYDAALGQATGHRQSFAELDAGPDRR